MHEGRQNAAYILMDAFSFYQEWSRKQQESLPIVGRGDLPGRTEPLTEAARTVIAAYLTDNRQAIELLHEAVAVEYCRFPVDLSKGFAALMPPGGKMREGVMLLSLEAILSAENGQAEQAVRSIISALALGHLLSKEPFLIPQLIRFACQGRAISALERVVNRTELASEQLRDLGRLLAQAECPWALSRAFIGERCGGINLCTHPSAEKLALVQNPVPMPVIEFYKLVGLLDKITIAYLDIMHGYIQAAQLPLHERYNASMALDVPIRRRTLLRGFGPAGAPATKQDLRTIAQLRAARVALAVQHYRLAKRRLPEGLAELVPAYLDAAPKDPFDGQDMRYERLAVGYVVYSIGEDLSDDGGKEEPPRTKGRRERGNYDITFIVER
jgi:hypothetical protein